MRKSRKDISYLECETGRVLREDMSKQAKLTQCAPQKKKLHILHYLKIGIMTVRGTDTQVQNYLCKPNGRLNCEG